MNEGSKTGLFWLSALVLAAFAAFISWPRSTAETAASSMVGKELFESFTDPLAASSMKITTFDAPLGELESFEVSKDPSTGVWSIPSRAGYPADGEDQMRQAATAMLGLKVLDIKSESPEDHDDFGVVEPDIEKLAPGDDGVGRLVTIKNDEGNNLVSIIIGNEDKDFPTHRYVRIPKQDVVYEVELDVSPLSTTFTDWIEDDLLQLSGLDIAGTKIRNYSAAVMLGLQGQEIVTQRSYDANLSLNDANQWSVDSMVVYDGKSEGAIRTLADDETLNTTALNKLKNALDDLKIADVVRKPEGMSGDLKANKSLVENNESIRSLQSRGFYPFYVGDSEEIDIRSTNGEILVDLKNGVQYVLRFGGLAGISTSDDEGETGPTAEPAESEGGAERYLLVTTVVNESMIPRPELSPVPQSLEELAALRNPTAAVEPGLILPNPLAPGNAPAEPSEPAAVEPTPSEQAPAENAAEAPAENGSDTPAESVPAEGEEAATGDAPVEATGEGTTEASGEGAATGRGGQQEEAAADDAQPPADEPPANAAVAEETPAIEPPAQAEPAADQAPKNEWDDMTEEEKQEYLESEQEKIKKQNERLIEEWNEQLEETRNKVRELNTRFADWYYIIPESTYKDLQIQLPNLIQKKDEAADAAEPAGLPGGVGLPQFNLGN